MENEVATGAPTESSIGDAFSGLITLPPLDVIIAIIGIIIFGIILGALLYLPVAEKNSPLSLDRLTNEMIWHYVPDWFVFLLGCVAFLTVSFVMISGSMRGT
ncbi:MAG: hypothetical protein K6G55_02620 [Selenomonadaceae bacterium]|nr:hypothetical protein [Selenomonadaceae bacterium]